VAERDPWATIPPIDHARTDPRRPEGDGSNKRQFPRYVLDVPAEVTGDAGRQDAVLHDISEGGAAVHASQPLFSNDQFVELHMEGQSALRGRVVREFKGGYALEFEERSAEDEKRREQVETFRKMAGSWKGMEG